MRPIMLGGRSLVFPAVTSLKHDGWIVKQIRAAGLQEIDVDPTRTPQQVVAALLDRLRDSGMERVVLGALLVPEHMAPKDWAPAIALEITALLDDVTSPADKLTVRAAMAEAVLGFFRNGLVSMRTFRTSSPVRPEPGADRANSHLSASAAV